MEIVLENTDAVRHALMLPGLNPMFTFEFTGRGVKSLRFVTPDEDVTLEFHCHVPTHEQLGMHGRLIVGLGGSRMHNRARLAFSSASASLLASMSASRASSSIMRRSRATWRPW